MFVIVSPSKPVQSKRNYRVSDSKGNLSRGTFYLFHRFVQSAGVRESTSLVSLTGLLQKTRDQIPEL